MKLHIVFELLVIPILLLINGFLSMAEMAAISSKTARLEPLARKGVKEAKLALDIIGSKDKFLAFIQVGITTVGITSGVFSGATFADDLNELLKLLGIHEKVSPAVSEAIVVSIVTYLSLVIGEIVPKRLAINNPEKILCSMAQPISFFSNLLSPFVYILDKSSELILKIFHQDEIIEQTISETELKELVNESTEQGVLAQSESSMLASILDLDQKRVSSVMTPKPELEWLNTKDDLHVNLEKMARSKHSKFPLADQDLVSVIGVVYVTDVIEYLHNNEKPPLEKIARQPVYLPQNKTALEVIEAFKKYGTDVALIIDEYGQLLGLVTLRDIAQAIVGQLSLAYDEQKWLIERDKEGNYLVDAHIPMDEFYKTFCPDQELDPHLPYETLAGLIINQLNRIPELGDSINSCGFEMTVVAMELYRIDKIKLTPLSQPADENSQ